MPLKYTPPPVPERVKEFQGTMVLLGLLIGEAQAPPPSEPLLRPRPSQPYRTDSGVYVSANED